MIPGDSMRHEEAQCRKQAGLQFRRVKFFAVHGKRSGEFAQADVGELLKLSSAVVTHDLDGLVDTQKTLAGKPKQPIESFVNVMTNVGDGLSEIASGGGLMIRVFSTHPYAGHGFTRD
jgi:LysM repeat protein